MRILLAHGWACGPAIWDGVAERLRADTASRDWEIVRADLGFFGPSDLPTGRFDLAAGHSLGFLWLLGQTEAAFDRLVAINGFTRFYADREFRFGTPRRRVERMAEAVRSEPLETLRGFYATCGEDGPPEAFPWWSTAGPDAERLRWGLQGLASWDYRGRLAGLGLAPTVVASADDRVVPRSATEACFPGAAIEWAPTERHLLPLVDPDRCATILRQAANH